MDISTTGMALKTCAQCKGSKKKCDKVLPKCSRCSRLNLDCAYDERPETTESVQEQTDSRFAEVFRRLQRIEAHVFDSTSPQNPSVPTAGAAIAPAKTPKTLENVDRYLNPNMLRPSMMGFVLLGSLLRHLDEGDTTIDHIGKRYFDTSYPWLLVVSPVKWHKNVERLKGMDTSNAFRVLVLAMHLVSANPEDHPSCVSLEDSPWYRTCKHHWAQFVVLGKVSLELLQAGILIALFEYTQCVSDRAFLTLGICGRLAYELELDTVAAQQAIKSPEPMSLEAEEKILTWWGLILLDRYVNLPPTPFPKHPVVSQKPFQVSFHESDSFPGLKASAFSHTSLQYLSNVRYELEGSRMLAQVQNVLLDNRDRGNCAMQKHLLEGTFPYLLETIEKARLDLKERQKDVLWFSGLATTLAAALQLRLFCLENGFKLGTDNVTEMRKLLAQLREVLLQCRLMMGFTESYCEGIRPSYISAAYLVIKTANILETMGESMIDEMTERSVFMELLQTLSRRFRLAGHCLHLLQSE